MEIKEGKKKRFVAIFDDGKKIEFGQKNPKTGTYIDHSDETKRKNLMFCYVKFMFKVDDPYHKATP
jgi:hypothetical protein